MIENNGQWLIVPDPDGYNIDTGVDIMTENAADELRRAYADIDSFNPFEDIYAEAEYKGTDFAAEVEDIAESIELIKEVD